MRLLNIKRLKTEKQHAVYRILVTYAFYWIGTVGHSRKTRQECRRKKLRRIFRSNYSRPKHNLITVAWLFGAKTYVFNLPKDGTDLHQYTEACLHELSLKTESCELLSGAYLRELWLAICRI